MVKGLSDVVRSLWWWTGLPYLVNAEWKTEGSPAVPARITMPTAHYASSFHTCKCKLWLPYLFLLSH